MVAHDLARDAQADARTFFLGRKERNEDLFLTAYGDGCSIVANVDDELIILSQFGKDVDVLCACLQGVFDQVDENLGDLSFIGINH